MTARRRVAVLGTGSIGARHIQVLGDAGFEPIAISVRAPGTVGGAPSGTLAARDLAEAASLGARQCVIATETGRHLEDAVAALDAGFDLFVEKPLDIDAARARQLCLAVAAAGRRAFTALVLRFSPSLNRFRALLPDIGDVHSARIECQSYLPDWRPSRPYRDSYSARERDGGVLRDLNHEVDYAGWIFGWPERVQGRLGNTGRLGIQADEWADMSWQAPGGAVVSIRIDYLTRHTRRRIVADGEHGTLTWDGVANRVVLARAGVDPIEETHAYERNEIYVAEDRAFVQASAGGSVDPRLATDRDGWRSLAVSDAVRRSSEHHAEEPVNYEDA